MILLKSMSFAMGLLLFSFNIAEDSSNKSLQALRTKRISQSSLGFDFRYLPSASMNPTIQVNDVLIFDEQEYKQKAPRRGDIVLFYINLPLTKNKNEASVKRIIGMPGETVEIKSGKVFIDKKLQYEPYILEPPSYEYGPKTIPIHSYFVLGDNRNNAFDSVQWGFLRRDHLLGKGIATFCPANHQKLLEKVDNLSRRSQEFITSIQSQFKKNPELCNLVRRQEPASLDALLLNSHSVKSDRT
jgi:signal peptidase I